MSAASSPMRTKWLPGWTRTTVAIRLRTWGCWRMCGSGGRASLPASPTPDSCSGRTPCYPGAASPCPCVSGPESHEESDGGPEGPKPSQCFSAVDAHDTNSKDPCVTWDGVGRC